MMDAIGVENKIKFFVVRRPETVKKMNRWIFGSYRVKSGLAEKRQEGTRFMLIASMLTISGQKG